MIFLIIEFVKTSFKSRLTLLISVLFCFGTSYTQTILKEYDPSWREYKFYANDSLGPFFLPDSFLLHNSIVVFAGEKQLQKVVHYQINELKGILFLKEYFPAVEMTVRYKIVKLGIPRTYRYKTALPFQKVQDTLKSLTNQSEIPISTEATSSYTLQRSGSILRAITIGTGQDMNIESSMRLELDGNITEDVEVEAVLSDQTTGITPEGNTKTIRELDRIYLQTKTPHTTVTMGDYALQLGQNNRFTKTQKRVQGVQFQWQKPRIQTQLSASITRARYRTVHFVATEGNQGPYLLTDGEQNLPTPVVPASERVMIDGIEQVRGETENYVIDYSTGEITFTPKTPIRQDSRITIEYETIPGYYNRGIFTSQLAGKTLGSKYHWSVELFSEADDVKNPVGITLTDSAKQALQNAGDNPQIAFYSSERYVGQGNGDYKKVDTLYYGRNLQIFVFVPPDTNLRPQGDYEVVFTKVTNGDYRVEFHSPSAKSFYVWVGTGLGEYLPIVKVPLPQKKELVAVSTELQPYEFTRLKVESALSKFDANLLSSKNGNGFTGGAITLESQIATPLSDGFSRFQTIIKYKEVESNFRPIERVDEGEEYRRWGSTDTLSQKGQITKEIEFRYYPFRNFNLRTNLGNQRNDDGNFSERYASSITYFLNNVSGAFAGEKIYSNNQLRIENSEILRLSQQQQWSFGHFKTAVQSSYEDFVNAQQLTKSGYKKLNNQFTVETHIANVQKLNFSVNRRNDWRMVHRQFHPSLRAIGFQFKHDINLPSFTANTEYHHNETRFLPSDSLIKTDLLQSVGNSKWKNNAVFLNWNYNLNSTSTSKLLLFAYPVPIGQGTHIKIGDQFVPNPEGDWIVFTRPSGDYEPVVDLNFNCAMTTYLDRIYSIKWRGMVLDTRVEINEQTRTKQPLKLMAFYLPEFLSDKTINGRQSLKQELMINPNKAHYWKIRTSILRERNNRWLTGAFENRSNFFSIFYRNTQNADWLWSMETQMERKLRDYFISAIANRESYVYKLLPSINYLKHLQKEYRVDALFSYSQDNAQKLKWYEVGVTPSYTFFWRKTGRIYFDVEWRTIITDAKRLPYDLALGRQPGNNWRWSIRGDFRMGTNVNGAISYRGIKDYSFPIRNEGRAEISAFF